MVGRVWNEVCGWECELDLVSRCNCLFVLTVPVAGHGQMYIHQATEFLPKSTCELGIMIRHKGGRHAMEAEGMVEEEPGYLGGSVGSVAGPKVD